MAGSCLFAAGISRLYPMSFTGSGRLHWLKAKIMSLNNRLVPRNVLVAFLLLLALSGATYLLTSNLRSLPDPAELVPCDSLALLKVKNLAKTIRTFKGSPFGQQLTDAEVADALGQFELDRQLEVQILQGVEIFNSLASHPLTRLVLSRQSALALLPADDAISLSPEAFILRNLVFVAQSKVPVAPGTFFAGILPGKVTFSHSTYHGETITAGRMENGRTIYYAALERSLVCAFSASAVERCVRLSKDRLLRPGLTLDQDQGYRQFRRQRGGADDLLLYLNLPGVLSTWEGVTSQSAGTWSYRHQERLIIAQRRTGKHSTLRMVLKGYAGKPDSILQQYRLAPPEPSPHLRQVVSGAAVYFWTNWLDVSTIWTVLSQAPTLKRATAMFFVAQKFYEHTGVDFVGFTSLLGSQFGFYINEVPSASFATVPMICLQLQLREPQEMKKLLRQQLGQVPTTVTRLGEVEAVSLIMARGLIQPTYAVVGEWLIIADHIKQIRQFLDTRKKALVRDAAFMKVDNGFSQNNNLVLYARIDKVNQGLNHLLTWGVRALGETYGLNPTQQDLLIKRLITPAFASLDGVRSQGIRLFAREQDLVLELDLLYSPSDN